jgi:tRNA nucleotidyltransferase (CCA-adding enzyme)
MPTTHIQNIPIPSAVEEILLTLTANGFDAYIVGGCLRDHLLGVPVRDWDVTTNAAPKDIISCFPHSRILDFGLKHNTLAILTAEGPVEITSYRSGSSDPCTMNTDQLRQDLAHRDFTVNALAYHPRQGLIDCFGGLHDLKQKILRCAENPAARLREDPVRIMRALRFAATKNFTIAPTTRAAMLRLRSLLAHVAQERITAELLSFLTGAGLKTYLMDYRDIFAVILPEIVPSFDFDQRNPYHCFDVWQHTAESVDHVTAEAPWPLHANDIPQLRLTMLLHDLGKPSCWSVDASGTGHFYGHPLVSTRLAAAILKRLKADKKTRLTVTSLVRHHDTPIPATPKKVLRLLHTLKDKIPLPKYLSESSGQQNPLKEPASMEPVNTESVNTESVNMESVNMESVSGIHMFCLLLHIKKADILAQNPTYLSRLSELERLYNLVLDIQAQNNCFTLRDLCINGKDLLVAGIPEGPSVGHLLNALLESVIDGTCPNSRDALLAEVRKRTENYA